MDSRMLLTAALVVPLLVLAGYGLYRVAGENEEIRRSAPGNVQTLSDWAFPAVG